MIKLLGVLQSFPSVSVSPRAIFAAEVIGPLSGESDEVLRARRGLRRYWEARDHRDAAVVSDDTVVNEGGDSKERVE